MAYFIGALIIIAIIYLIIEYWVILVSIIGGLIALFIIGTIITYYNKKPKVYKAPKVKTPKEKTYKAKKHVDKNVVVSKMKMNNNLESTIDENKAYKSITLTDPFLGTSIKAKQGKTAFVIDEVGRIEEPLIHQIQLSLEKEITNKNETWSVKSMYQLNDERRITAYIKREAQKWLFNNLRLYKPHDEQSRNLFMTIHKEKCITDHIYAVFVKSFINNPLTYVIEGLADRVTITSDDLLMYFISYNNWPLPLGFIFEFFEDDYGDMEKYREQELIHNFLEYSKNEIKLKWEGTRYYSGNAVKSIFAELDSISAIVPSLLTLHLNMHMKITKEYEEIGDIIDFLLKQRVEDLILNYRIGINTVMLKKPKWHEQLRTNKNESLLYVERLVKKLKKYDNQTYKKYQDFRKTVIGNKNKSAQG